MKKRLYVASVSWGKDSTRMLELILQTNRVLDLVIFVNTGYEFDSVYAVRDKALEKLREHNVTYVEIDMKHAFEHYMFFHNIQAKDGSIKVGYKWCGGVCRWGTALKLKTLHHYYTTTLWEYDITEYIGIAADEWHRVDRKALMSQKKRYPLVEEGLTEYMCLMDCYQMGYTWEEDGIRLYDILDRLSCWCCKNKNLKELKNMYYLLPKYWKRLERLQLCFADMPMKGEAKDVFGLKARFQREGRELLLSECVIEKNTVSKEDE